MATVDASLIAQLPLLAGFGAEELSEAVREARSLRFSKNSAVFQHEDAHSREPTTPRCAPFEVGTAQARLWPCYEIFSE